MKKKRVMCFMYRTLVGRLMIAMEWSDISHALSLVSGYMENLGKAIKWVLRYFRGTSITYHFYHFYYVDSMEMEWSIMDQIVQTCSGNWYC